MIDFLSVFGKFAIVCKADFFEFFSIGLVSVAPQWTATVVAAAAVASGAAPPFSLLVLSAAVGRVVAPATGTRPRSPLLPGLVV